MFDDSRQVLLVREKTDAGRWTLPGGWADVGYSPFEVAVKEAREESGLEVRATRLLALLDKRKHDHPAQPWYIYKAFIRCEVKGGALAQETAETSGARWFTQKQLKEIELSADRITEGQLDLLFRFADDPELPTICD
jgi:ADP-ribose pyrophosphatase YjhB (NUDIX family)